MRIHFWKTKLDDLIEELSHRIYVEYADRGLYFVVVMDASFIFAADLARWLSPTRIDFLKLSSYNKIERSEIVQIDYGFDVDALKGKKVLIIDTIVDSGASLRCAYDYIKDGCNPLDVKTCVLLDKLEARKFDVPVDFSGLVVPNEFFVGYGLDYNGMYRGYPDICVMEQEDL